MSRRDALANVSLEPAARWGHTEYSLEYHGAYLAQRLGLPSDHPELTRRAYDRFAFDMLWSTNDGLVDWAAAGRTTDMGHADYAIDLAIQAEGGCRHTAVMHSKNLDNLSRMAKECNCSIFVKNGRSQAGLGLGGEGHCSFTIASPTGEGLTSPRSFSRWRRCVLVDHFRIV